MSTPPKNKGKPKPKPDRASLNRKRSSYISFLKRKNYKLKENIDELLKADMYTEVINDGQIIHSRIGEERRAHLEKLGRTTNMCANYSLYSYNQPANDITYIASGTCNHKCCFICNWHRQKMLRRKYRQWFALNQFLYTIHVPGAKGLKTVTNAQIEKYPGATIVHKNEYDLMHLTLTVPHYADSGFRGNKYFYAEIIELFNWMRKDKEWLNLVYGGEFGVETERKENGLHIHIHSLLMVKKQTRSRNQLHKFVLLKWNRLTVNPDNPREVITDFQREKIKVSNCDLKDEDINQLNPKGSTFIGLEIIYTMQDGIKCRSNEFNSDAMIKAIMETISYHFEPHAFNKENNEINIDLLAEILPHVYRKVLYKKFGVLHGEKTLNIKSELDADDIQQNYREAAAIECDQDGVIISERQFFISNPANFYHDRENDNRIYMTRKAKSNIKILPVETGSQAVKIMSDMIKNSFNTGQPDNIN